MLRMCVFFSILICTLIIAGCGGNSSSCSVIGLNVSPTSATVDHTAAAPANGQDFNAFDKFSGNGCIGIATAAFIPSNWTASDPSVHLTTTPSGQLTATCTASVANPITITATSADGHNLTGQATLTCK